MNLPRAFGLLLALMFVAPISSCATAGPVVVACGANEIPIALADYNAIKADVQARDWIDLAKIAGRIGYDVMGCALEHLGTSEPALKPGIEEFKREKAVEFRSVQPATSSNWRTGRTAFARAPGDGGPGWRGGGG